MLDSAFIAVQAKVSCKVGNALPGQAQTLTVRLFLTLC